MGGLEKMLSATRQTAKVAFLGAAITAGYACSSMVGVAHGLYTTAEKTYEGVKNDVGITINAIKRTYTEEKDAEKEYQKSSEEIDQAKNKPAE